jgi:DNA-binding NarL/FixJ family response regulator
MKIRLVVADDVAVVLRLEVLLLQDTCDIVATASDGPSALEAIRKFKPDIAVLDLEMPGLSGIEVTRLAIEEQPRLGVIICSIYNDRDLVQWAKEAGVRGYVAKTDLFRNLPEAVKAGTSDGTFFHSTRGTAIMSVGVLHLLL